MNDEDWQKQEDEIRKEVRINTYSQGYEKTRETIIQNGFAMDKQIFYLSSGIIIISFYAWIGISQLYSVCLFGKIINLLLLICPMGSAMRCFLLNLMTYKVNTKILNSDINLHTKYLQGEDNIVKVMEERNSNFGKSQTLTNKVWFWLKMSIFACVINFSVLYLVNNKIEEKKDENKICNMHMRWFKKNNVTTNDNPGYSDYDIAHGMLTQPIKPMDYTVKREKNTLHKSTDGQNTKLNQKNVSKTNKNS